MSAFVTIISFVIYLACRVIGKHRLTRMTRTPATP